MNYERPIPSETVVPGLKLAGKTLYQDNFGTPKKDDRNDTGVITKKMKE